MRFFKNVRKRATFLHTTQAGSSPNFDTMCILTYWRFSFFIFSSLLGHPPHNIDPKASFSEFSLRILHAKPFQDLKFYFHFGSKFSLESRAKLLSFNTMGNQANLRNKLKKESNIKKSFLARSKKMRINLCS